MKILSLKLYCYLLGMLWLNGNELGFGLRGLGSRPPQVGVLCFLGKYFPFSVSLSTQEQVIQSWVKITQG